MKNGTSLIKGQRFKGAVNSGSGFVLCRNDYRGSKKVIEAYNVEFDGGVFRASWWRCHMDYVEPKWRVVLRRLITGQAITARPKNHS